MEKKKWFLVLSVIFGTVLFLPIMGAIRKTGVERIVCAVLIGVCVVGTVTFAILAIPKEMKRKKVDIEQVKNNLANIAFDNLLKRDVDYTVVDEVEGAILVKKIVSWYYCIVDKRRNLNAMFTITTDKGEFAFQYKEKRLYRVPTELVTSIMGEPKRNKEISAQSFDQWLDQEIEGLNQDATAFNLNLHENANSFSAEFVATASFDEANEDWATDEINSDGNDGKEFVFEAKDEEHARKFAERALLSYLNAGKHADVLKNSKAVAVGYNDVGFKIIYKNPNQ